jgi:hypothetical protein
MYETANKKDGEWTVQLILGHYTRTSSSVAVERFSDFRAVSIVNELCVAEISVSRRRRGILWAVCQPCRGASRTRQIGGPRLV